MPEATVQKSPKVEPTFTLDEEYLPEIKDWKVGHRYTITMEVEQVGLTKGDEYGPVNPSEKPPQKMQARFKVISAVAGEESEEPSEEEIMKDTEMTKHKGKMARLHNRYGEMEEES